MYKSKRIIHVKLLIVRRQSIDGLFECLIFSIFAEEELQIKSILAIILAKTENKSSYMFDNKMFNSSLAGNRTRI